VNRHSHLLLVFFDRSYRMGTEIVDQEPSIGMAIQRGYRGKDTERMDLGSRFGKGEQ